MVLALHLAEIVGGILLACAMLAVVQDSPTDD